MYPKGSKITSTPDIVWPGYSKFHVYTLPGFLDQQGTWRRITHASGSTDTPELSWIHKTFYSHLVFHMIRTEDKVGQLKWLHQDEVSPHAHSRTGTLQTTGTEVSKKHTTLLQIQCRVLELLLLQIQK